MVNRSTLNPMEPNPSVSLTYEFVRPLYELYERRYIAVETRIQQLLAFALTVMLAPVTIIGATQKHLTPSLPFFIAGVALTLLLVIGLFAISWGHFSVFPLQAVVNNTASHSKEQFKREILSGAIYDNNRNRQLINRKGKVIWVMTLLLVLEGTSLVWWLFNSLSKLQVSTIQV